MATGTTIRAVSLEMNNHTEGKLNNLVSKTGLTVEEVLNMAIGDLVQAYGRGFQNSRFTKCINARGFRR